jgi:hypothetical protein
MDEKTTYILSLDWDYVTGDCQGSKRYCCGFCDKYNSSLGIRVRGRGEAEHMRRDWKKRFEQLKNIPINFGTPVYVSECHASIIEAAEEYYSPYEVMDFDSHYDKYSDGKLCCGNWIYHLERLGGFAIKTPKIEWVDAVFLCRSAPWTPRSMDRRFYELVRNYCIRAETEPEFIGHMRKSFKKTYQRLYGN